MDHESVGVPVEAREEEALQLARQLHGQVSSLRAKARACGEVIANGGALPDARMDAKLEAIE